MEEEWEAIDDEEVPAGGIGGRYKVKRRGKVVAEADDPVSARMRAKQERRVHPHEHVSVHDGVRRIDEPLD